MFCLLLTTMNTEVIDSASVLSTIYFIGVFVVIFIASFRF